MPQDIEFQVDQRGSCQPTAYEIRCVDEDCTQTARVKVHSSIGSGSGLADGENLARYELKVNEDGSKTRMPLANGSDDKTIVARSQWQFERFMYGAEWLWSKAGSPVLTRNDGYKPLHEAAVNMAKNMAEKRAITDNKYMKVLEDLEHAQNDFMSNSSGMGSGDTVHSTGNSASSVEFLTLMAQHHAAMVAIDMEKAGNYIEYLGSGSGLAQMHLHSETIPKQEEEGDRKYSHYGEHDDWWYCSAWFPHCWVSTNICGTRLEENRVCVIEKQKAGSLSGGGSNMLDPLYPVSVLNPTQNSQDANYGGNMAAGAGIGAAGGMAVCGPPCAGLGPGSRHWCHRELFGVGKSRKA